MVIKPIKIIVLLWKKSLDKNPKRAPISEINIKVLIPANLYMWVCCWWCSLCNPISAPKKIAIAKPNTSIV